MLRLFKSFGPQTVLILLLFAVVMKMRYYSILSPFTGTSEDEWAYNLIIHKTQRLFGQHSILYPFVVFINLLLQALFVNRIAAQYKLFPQSTFIPAAVYIIISSFFTEWNTLSATLLAAWPILITLNNMISLNHKTHSAKTLFNSGMLIALASILYYPAIIFFIYIIWSLILLKSIKFKDIITIILGFSLPIYFLLGTLYILDIPVQDLLKLDLDLLPAKTIFTHSKYLSGIIFLLILLALGIYALNRLFLKMIESVKNAWWNIIIILILSSIMAVFPAKGENSSWLISIIPCSLIIAAIWYQTGAKWIKIACFWSLIIFVAYQQYFWA